MSVDSSDLVEYLRAQPEDFVLDWYVDTMSPEQDWDVAWVDVMFQDRLAWVISSGFCEDEEDDLHWPPDMVVSSLLDPTKPDFPYVAGIVLPLGGRPTAEEIEQMRTAYSLASNQAYWTGAPAWSAREINRAIEDWCLREVGRPIQARWNAEHGPSPLFAEMTAMVDAMKSGVEPKYLLRPGEAEGGTGPSVYASEQVMELLMQDFAEVDE